MTAVGAGASQCLISRRRVALGVVLVEVEVEVGVIDKP